MKRDMDLLRKILLEIEEDPRAIGVGWIELEVPGHERDEVSYHVRLLADAGLVAAAALSEGGLDWTYWKPTRLTWSGHEFLNLVRQENTWAAAKKVVLEKTGGLSFDLLWQLLLKLSGELLLGA